ncbi:MAG: hypothetical protein ACE3JQ_09050 [Paenisporosarcina sp.]
MKRNNEAGYTLLLTLALIVIVIGFIGTLSFLTLNQQTQVENTDEKFLLSDVTEMGIEYYRNLALEDYVKTVNQVKENIQDEISNSPKEKYDTEAEVRALEISKERLGLHNLKTTLSSYSINPIPIEEPLLNFSLSSAPYEVESSNPSFFRYKFTVKGSNENESEIYSFTVLLPTKLIHVSISPSGNGNGADSIINYSKTIPTPNFSPPTNLKNCNGTYTDKECISTSKFIKDIENSKVYYQGDIGTNSANNTDFKKSIMIVDGNLDAKNFNGISNVSIFVNGSTSIDQLNATNINLYSSGTISLNKHITISDSKIRSMGALFATNKGMSLSNVHMVLEGENNSIDPFSVTNSSTVCIKDDSDLDELYIDSSSSVYILNSAIRTGLNIRNSKLPEMVDINSFNEKCYGVSNSNNEIVITIDSNLSITPETILEEIDFDESN